MTLSKARVSGCFGCIAICFAFSGCSSDVTSPASDNNEEGGGSSRDGAKATVGELSVEDACRSLLECLDPVPNSRLRARLASCEVIYADGNPSIVNISGEILISVDRKRWTFQARLAPPVEGHPQMMQGRFFVENQIIKAERIN